MTIHQRFGLRAFACAAAFLLVSMSGQDSDAATVRLTVQNLGTGTTPVTPVFAAFHNGSYDIARTGSAATNGLERLAEVGNNAPISGEFGTANGRVSNSIGGGPITPGSMASFDFDISTTGNTNSYLSLASMVLPSNDYFFGTVSNPGDTTFGVNLSTLFATGTQTFTLNTVYDAGTEDNDFAFSAPPIPGAAGLFAGGPFATIPNSNPGGGMTTMNGTIQAVATPFATFANSPLDPANLPAIGGLQITLTAVPEPSSAFACVAIGGCLVMRRRRRNA